MLKCHSDRYRSVENCTLEENVPLTRFHFVEDEITENCTSCTDLIHSVNGLQERLSSLQDSYRWEANLSQTFWRTMGSLYSAYEMVYYKLEPNMRPMKFNVDNHIRI